MVGIMLYIYFYETLQFLRNIPQDWNASGSCRTPWYHLKYYRIFRDRRGWYENSSKLYGYL